VARDNNQKHNLGKLAEERAFQIQREATRRKENPTLQEQLDQWKDLAQKLHENVKILKEENHQLKKFKSNIKPLLELSKLSGLLNSKYLPLDEEVSDLLLHFLRNGLRELNQTSQIPT
jgi:vacuolar-type H+-ATPase subunit I/STV1